MRLLSFFQSATSSPLPDSLVEPRVWGGLTSSQIEDCYVKASHLSGLPVRTRANFASANLFEIPASILRRKHYDMGPAPTLSASPSSPLWARAALGALRVAQAAGLPAAAYLDKGHQVIANPVIGDFHEYMGLLPLNKIMMVHEFAHALQHDAFPEIFARQQDAQAAMFALYEEKGISYSSMLDPDQDAVDETFDTVQLQAKIVKAQAELQPRFDEITHQRRWDKILTEGHALWVQHKAMLVYGISDLPWHQRRLTTLFDFGSRDIVYRAGAAVVTETEKLQAQLESSPFFDAKGRWVSLRKDLRGKGLVRLLFAEPDFLQQLLPNFDSKAKAEIRIQVDIQPLLQKVKAMIDHEVCDVPLRDAVSLVRRRSI